MRCEFLVTLRRGLRVLLETHPGWECCAEADSGEEAIRAVVEFKPDLIIMDVSMPGMGGVQATKIIHETFPTIGILLLTLHKSTELLRAAFSAGASAYVLKTCDVLQAWKKESPLKSDYVFPSPVVPTKPISTVKTAWKATLRRAGVTAFPIYNLRHVFCTRLSEVTPDAVVQQAMRHTSPETKRHYQLGMAEQVRQAVEKTNKRLYGKRAPLHFRDSLPQKGEEEKNRCL
jgi:CheY-like chemotaxis protein